MTTDDTAARHPSIWDPELTAVGFTTGPQRSPAEDAPLSDEALVALGAEYDAFIAELDAGREVCQISFGAVADAIDSAPQFRGKPVGIDHWTDMAVADIEEKRSPITMQEYIRWALEGRVSTD